MSQIVIVVDPALVSRGVRDSSLTLSRLAEDWFVIGDVATLARTVKYLLAELAVYFVPEASVVFPS